MILGFCHYAEADRFRPLGLLEPRPADKCLARECFPCNTVTGSSILVVPARAASNRPHIYAL